MRINNAFKFISAVVVCELAGLVGSYFTAPGIPTWYASLVKPYLSPSDAVFAPVWIILYFLMGISLYLVWKNNWKVGNWMLPFGAAQGKRKDWNRWSERFWTGDLQKGNVILIFCLQLFLNILWPLIFFSIKLPSLAFFEILMLWFAIIYTMVNFYRISKSAAYLLLPYLLWVSFAVYLNLAIWMLN